MTRKRKRRTKREKMSLKFEGKRITIVKHGFLPPKTVALSTDLYNEMRDKK